MQAFRQDLKNKGEITTKAVFDKGISTNFGFSDSTKEIDVFIPQRIPVKIETTELKIGINEHQEQDSGSGKAEHPIESLSHTLQPQKDGK